MTTNTQGSTGGDTLIGQTIQGHYRVIERVAKGGMAWIYRAEHTQLRNDMAIKILFPQLLEEPELCERFLEEARIQFGLKHPNIVQVTDVISEGGLVGIVLEWINGRDLRYWLREHRQPFTSAQLHEVMLPVIEAIQYAHEKNIVHRDLKPGNILFQHEGKRIIPKVADFGIAKLMTEVDSQTKTGTMMGTLQYMSPEQIRDSKYVDQRSDIYSLGVILFRMATGRLPFRDKNALSLMRKHEMVAPPIPSELTQNIPPELDALLLRCLEKDPDDRFESCTALAEALNQLPGVANKSSSDLLSAILIGQPAVDDFGDPHQSTPHGVKRISFGAGDELPTGSIAVDSPSSAGLALGRQQAHQHTQGDSRPPQSRPPQSRPPQSRPPQSRPPQSRPPRPLQERDDNGPATFLEAPLASQDVLRPVNGPAPIPTTRGPQKTALDQELPSRVRDFLLSEQINADPSQPLVLDETGPTPTPTPPQPQKASRWPLVLMGLFLCLGLAGGYVYWTQYHKTPTPIVTKGRTSPLPPVPRKLSMIEKLDKAVASALRSIQLQKLGDASDQLRYAMRLKSTKGKRPTWQQSKYFPELFRVAANVARGRGQLYTAKRYYEQYGGADMQGKSPEKIAQHKEKTESIKKEILPQLKAELKTRVDKANTLLAGIAKGVATNRFARALSLYQSLRQTVSSVPSVYRKLANTLREFFPALSMSIYKNILEEMLPPDKLAAEIQQEKNTLQQEIDKRQQLIQTEFATASALAKAGKFKKISVWLRKQYQKNQSFGLFHQQMVRLLLELVGRDMGRAQKLLSLYMSLFQKYTQKGLAEWAKTSKTPLALPDYDKLKKMQDMLKRWQQFSRVINKVSSAINKGAFDRASRLLRSLPDGWRDWIKEDQWGFHTYIALGATLTTSHQALQRALLLHKKHQQSLQRGYLEKAKPGFAQLDGYLARHTSSLAPLLGRRTLQRWRKQLAKQQKRSDKASALLASAKGHYWRKRWKESEVDFGRYLKFLPKTHLLTWVKKKIHQCQCNRNVPWVWCKNRKPKK